MFDLEPNHKSSPSDSKWSQKSFFLGASYYGHNIITQIMIATMDNRNRKT